MLLKYHELVLYLITGTLFAVLLLFNATGYATTITVNTTGNTSGDDGVCTLQEAISSANSNLPSGTTPGECAAGDDAESEPANSDAIVFDFTTDSTISLSSGPLDISRNISIINDTGYNITIRRDGTDKFNIFSVSSVTFTLSNLTIENGYPNFGGNGGAINNNGGTVTIDNCTFSDNQESAFYNNGGIVNITNSTFSDNQASKGGGIYNTNTGTITITNSTFSNNQASSGNGGAIYNDNNGTITITDSTITGNTATNGGGIYNNSGTVTLENTVVAQNTATTNPDLQGTFATNGSNIIGNNTGAESDFPDGLPNAFPDGDYVGTTSNPVVPYTITLGTDGTGSGNVSSTPTGIDCGTNCTKYGSGTTVSLNATPQSGSSFDERWTGTGCANPVTITADRTCTASFSLSSFNLTINTSGNGTVTPNPTGTDCGTDCFQYTTGTSISLTTTADNNYVFDEWSGDAGCDNSVTITADMDCTASFTEEETEDDETDEDDEETTSSSNRRGMDPLPREMTIFVELYGNGSGSVNSEPLGIHCETADCTRIDYQRDLTGVECDPNDCAHQFQTADYVILNAIPDAGSLFVGWGGHPDCADDEIWMIGNKLCIAFFQKSHPLTVGQAGDGMGNLQSNPTGIDCGNGGSTCVKEFRQNSTVNLRATPATGSRFAGWQGDCDGSTVRTPVKIDTAKNCTAYFVASP